MSRLAILLMSFTLGCVSVGAQAQSVQTGGVLITVPASGEVRYANDEAHATLMIEEQDKDKSTAASRVNQKMKQGIEIIKREDPQAILKTYGYYTYPVYSDESTRTAAKARQITGWRVGQYIELTTVNLVHLPKTIAASQRILALNGLQFGLAEATGKRLDAQRIEAAYKHLSERIAVIAKAMGRNVADAVLESIDFETSTPYAQQDKPMAKMAMRATASMDSAPVEEPSFEPGETTSHMQLVGKLRFK